MEGPTEGLIYTTTSSQKLRASLTKSATLGHVYVKCSWKLNEFNVQLVNMHLVLWL
jgi:hypothetical protein